MEAQHRTISRAAKEEGGLYWFLGTSEAVDSHDSIIRADGADFSRFRENPVVLLDHENRVDSIGGRVEEIRAVESPKGWEFGIRFASGESPRAAQAERLADAGFLRGSSIGFIPKVVRQDLSDAERALLGLGRFGYVVEEWELLELTVVPVGSNPEALKRAVAAGVLEPDDVSALRTRPNRVRVSGKRESGDDSMRETLMAMADGLRDITEAQDENVAALLGEMSNLGAAMAGAVHRIEAKLDLVAGLKSVEHKSRRKPQADLYEFEERIEAACKGGGGPDGAGDSTTAGEME